MKKVIIIIVILLICCSVLGIWIVFNNKLKENNANILAKDMIKGFENSISFDYKKEEKEEIQEVEEQKEILKEDTTQQEQVIEPKQEIENNTNNKPIETSSSKKTGVEKEETKSSQQPSNTKVETKKEEIITTPTPTPTPQPASEPTPVVETPKNENIYCVDGGKIHIAGDGPNEHGYYNSWEQAEQALKDYTNGWESSHFKINQCACGLYYFWAIK